MTNGSEAQDRLALTQLRSFIAFEDTGYHLDRLAGVGELIAEAGRIDNRCSWLSAPIRTKGTVRHLFLDLEGNNIEAAYREPKTE